MKNHFETSNELIVEYVRPEGNGYIFRDALGVSVFLPFNFHLQKAVDNIPPGTIVKIVKFENGGYDVFVLDEIGEIEEFLNGALKHVSETPPETEVETPPETEVETPPEIEVETPPEIDNKNSVIGR